MNKKVYTQFKDNDLPTPFWDKERETYEYVWYDPELNVFNNLTESFEHITTASLYYPFDDCHIVYDGNEDKVIIGHGHAHSFEEVLERLYNSPESFKIKKENEEFYSKQELKFIKDVQNYLLSVGLKDKTNPENNNDRYKKIKETKLE